MKNTIKSAFISRFAAKSDTEYQKSIAYFAGQNGHFFLRLLSVAAMFFILSVLPFDSAGQLPCNGVTTSCVLSPSQPYECITGPTDFQSLINANKLASVANAPNTVQRIVIKGDVSMNVTDPAGYTFAPGSEIVFADQSSGITINASRKLTLNGVKVYGCQEMWRSIYVQAYATFIAQSNCEFKDGLKAIHVEPYATISITGNTFRRNLKAIELGQLGTGIRRPIYFAQGGGISGNKFYGDETLKSPYVGRRPLQGINVFTVNNITIGAAGALNEFHSFEDLFGGELDFCLGMWIDNSIVTVTNTQFDGMAPSSGSMQLRDGAIAAHNNSTVTVQGLGAGSNTFFNCHTGIFLRNSNADVSNANFERIGQGVSYDRTLSSVPANSLKIINCDIKSFFEDGVSATSGGLFVPLNFSALEISDCLFDDNALYLGTKHAIIISSAGPATGSSYKILDNDFFFRDRTWFDDFFIFTGISLTNINGGIGQGNDFYDQGTTTITSSVEFTGIKTQMCNGFRWYYNNLEGVNSVGTFFVNERGFDVYDSPNCIYGCNDLDKLGYGMRFHVNCNASNLYNNDFNAHSEIGLALYDNGTVIGGQNRKYNRWNGSISPMEAYMEFDGYNPFNPAHIAQVKKSLFTIHTSNQNTASWPDPRIVESTMLGNDPNWFVAYTGPLPPIAVFLCPLLQMEDPKEHGIDEGERSIIDGNYSPYDDYPASTWDASFLLYERLDKSPDLRPASGTEDAWYQAQYNANLGKLRRVYDGYIALTTAEEGHTSTELLSDLNDITVNYDYEQNLKSVLGILLEVHANDGTPPTSQQMTELNTIADKCRYEGGIGVALARVALGQDVYKDGDCPQNRTNQSVAGITELSSLEMSVSPNPAKGTFVAQMNRFIEDGTAILSDIRGQTIATWPVNGSSLTVRDLQTSAGIYVLEIREQGRPLAQTRIVIVN